MKRFSKIALIPAAVTAVLAGNVYAGTEACFEVYKNADNTGVSAFDTKYTGAACVTPRTTAGGATLETLNETSIAYELTGNLSIDFDDIEGDGTFGDQQIIYIPTTDIPGGSKIEFEITGALFDGNANQVHLVKLNDDGDIEAIGSSDGTVDGTNVITIITKDNVVGAGTRLAFSRVATGNEFAVDPIGIKIANEECTTATTSKSVSIRATEAISDGGTGFSIQGGVSSFVKIADISPQFYAFQDGTTAVGDVNAESSNAAGQAVTARTEFVFDADASKQLVVRKNQVIYKTAFYDRGATLDRNIVLTVSDKLETSFVASVMPGTTVDMGLFNSRTAATGVLATQEPVEIGTTWGDFGLTKATAPVYETYALDVFTPEATGGDVETNAKTSTSNLFGADYNQMFYAVTNTSATGIMNFNYDVNTHYTLDFGNADYIDHCELSKVSHEVGVNGAVLKVPYVVNGEGNFVRVTNEHDESAEVTVDVFGESANGNTNNRKVTAVKLGTVAAKSSVVYFVPKLIEEAVAQKGYTGADGGYSEGALGANTTSNSKRHSLTFTVTAPRDLVHGVAVQRVAGASDRVMPVLDQNEWSQ